ncbi:uncharacterized protein Z520_06357 [Fonsecaea multimorphosa CBS 102226]|uniref:Uncharacterized protein n=1 Tax=Fonsecaea multimorphosa CBS 102226 TaxID=1442371 RepID=A0A0D2H6T8_9EURO|nr:uncharacterized protein Z520_06357 [Fonsecaea multimorphosa CBS 102226]KIX97580.1 hypothetical protein Z520_06357 [Fonsecaea multimorphosa CBS 102226]OAL24045.1 hypothetical protein AYO22_05926 [Fonsecaea multimorphosa]
MGCGSSRLKGADIPDVNTQTTTITQSQPIKKVRTNFSDVDYDQDARQRRLTEYAPHEQPPPVREESRDFTAEQSSYEQYQQYDNRPDRPAYDTGGSATYANDRTMSGASGLDRDNDATLKPYQTIDGGDWDNQDDQQRRQSSYANGMQDGQDPTSDSSKNDFASANDPANRNYQDGSQSAQRESRTQSQADGHNNADDQNTSPTSYNTNPDIHDDDGDHKKSWFGQKYASFQSSKRGTGLSDEDILKYTGKDRSELNEWAQNRAGVGGNQEAGRIGSDSGLAAGAPWN